MSPNIIATRLHSRALILGQKYQLQFRHVIILMLYDLRLLSLFVDPHLLVVIEIIIAPRTQLADCPSARRKFAVGSLRC